MIFRTATASRRKLALKMRKILTRKMELPLFGHRNQSPEEDKSLIQSKNVCIVDDKKAIDEADILGKHKMPGILSKVGLDSKNRTLKMVRFAIF